MKQLTKDDIFRAAGITVLFDQMFVEMPDERLPYSIDAGDTLWVQNTRMWDHREYEELVGIAKHPTPEEAIQLLIQWGCLTE